MSFRDEPRPRHSSNTKLDVSRKLVECYPHKSPRESTLDLNTSQSTIGNHLKEKGKVSIKNVPHWPRGEMLYFSMILFTNPSARAGYDTRSVFKRSLTGLNSEFSFS